MGGMCTLSLGECLELVRQRHERCPQHAQTKRKTLSPQTLTPKPQNPYKQSQHQHNQHHTEIRIENFFQHHGESVIFIRRFTATSD